MTVSTTNAVFDGGVDLFRMKLQCKIPYDPGKPTCNGDDPRTRGLHQNGIEF